MKKENHIIKLKEHIHGLEWGIRQDNHSAVGFHASAGSVELLSILLHKLEIVSLGFQINHTWFRSKKIIETKFDFNFPKKLDIMTLMEEIEELRNPLCYGSPRPEETIVIMLEKFNGLKKIIEKLAGESYG